MKMLGDEIFIQRGETFSLDFELKDANGRPFCIPKFWRNPYLTITVSAALYKQKGDFRRTYWLDLSPLKKFISTEALYIVPYQHDLSKPFAISEVMSKYENIIALDKNKDNDITNYLFCTDPNRDGKLVYKYVENYELDGNGGVIEEHWTEYNCRFVKYFDTKDWVEQRYLYDANIVSGTTVLEYLNGILARDNIGELVSDANDEMIRNAIASLKNGIEREYLGKVYESGRALMPEYDTKFCLWLPKKIFVSVDLQGEI